MRRRVADEVLPELTGPFWNLGWRLQAHQPFLEPFAGEGPSEGFLYHEDHPVAALAQNAGDPDAIIGGTEGALREEDHGTWRRVVRHRPRRSSDQGPGRRAQLISLVQVSDSRHSPSRRQ